MASQIDTLHAKLRKALALERKAATRLLRAQTIFAKRYATSRRYLDQIEALERQAEAIDARIIGKDTKS